MEYKILNFPEAMKISKIILFYFTIEEIGKFSVFDFIIELISKIKEEEIILLENILIENFSSKSPNEIFNFLGESLVKNNILEMLSYYKQLGFK